VVESRRNTSWLCWPGHATIAQSDGKMSLAIARFSPTVLVWAISQSSPDARSRIRPTSGFFLGIRPSTSLTLRRPTCFQFMGPKSTANLTGRICVHIAGAPQGRQGASTRVMLRSDDADRRA
jgi:hypothetical protein